MRNAGILLLLIPVMPIPITVSAQSEHAFSSVFITDGRIEALKQAVAFGEEPTTGAYRALLEFGEANLDREPHVLTEWYVPGFYNDAKGHASAKQGLCEDANAAYGLALCYRMTGEQKYADTALRLINAWATGVETMSMKDDSTLSFSYHCPAMVFGADLLRDQGVWPEEQQAAFEGFLRDKALPMNTMRRANNWGNWGMVLAAACAVYLEDDALFEQCAARWKEFAEKQIDAQGHLHHEVTRNEGRSGVWYSHFSLMPQTIAAEILRVNGIDLYDYRTASGKSLRDAYGPLAGWSEHPETFPYWDKDPAELGGVTYFSYFEILNPRWPSAAATRLLRAARPMTARHCAPFLTFTHGQPLPEEVHLVADDIDFSRVEGVSRRVHPCEKLPEPVLTPQMPWEAQRIYVYGTVMRDEENGGFRMWYMSVGSELDAPRDPRLSHKRGKLMMYARSGDGVRWERPNLGLYAFNGSKENNIVFDYDSPSVVYDASSPPNERYKMLGCGNAGDGSGYIVAHSPDGLHWQDYPENPVTSGGDTCTLCFDPYTRTYLAFLKRNDEIRNHKRRVVYLTTSNDMQSWSEPVLVMAPDETDDAQLAAEGGISSQFYNMSAFPIGGQFLGFVTHFRLLREIKDTAPAQSGHDGPIDVQLVRSRDGRAWERLEDRTPVIPNGPHAYDAGCILGITNLPVNVGDETWFYYTAITTTHGGALPEKKITIARAAWRREGFVSLDAGEISGEVETHALVSAGRALFVNAKAAGGEVAVEVLDEAGQPLPGYGREDATPLNGDGIRQAVQWRKHDTLPVDGKVRLRFHLRQASLFSYILR